MAMNVDFDIGRPTLFFIACFFGIALLAHKLRRNSWRNKFRKFIYRKDEQGQETLRIAVLRGNESIVQLLVTQGADINAADKNGYTALIYAIAKGQEAIVQRLLVQGADIKAFHKVCCTALIYAAASGREAIVKLLLE